MNTYQTVLPNISAGKFKSSNLFIVSLIGGLIALINPRMWNLFGVDVFSLGESTDTMILCAIAQSVIGFIIFFTSMLISQELDDVKSNVTFTDRWNLTSFQGFLLSAAWIVTAAAIIITTFVEVLHLEKSWGGWGLGLSIFLFFASCFSVMGLKEELTKGWVKDVKLKLNIHFYGEYNKAVSTLLPHMQAAFGIDHDIDHDIDQEDFDRHISSLIPESTYCIECDKLYLIQVERISHINVVHDLIGCISENDYEESMLTLAAYRVLDDYAIIADACAESLALTLIFSKNEYVLKDICKIYHELIDEKATTK